MLPTKSRGQFLVSLANSNLKEGFNNKTQSDNPNKPQDIPAVLYDNIDADLDSTIELPNSTCNDLLTGSFSK